MSSLQIFSIVFGDLCDLPHTHTPLLLKDLGSWNIEAVHGGIRDALILCSSSCYQTNSKTATLNHQTHQILPFQSEWWYFH